MARSKLKHLIDGRGGDIVPDAEEATLPTDVKIEEHDGKNDIQLNSCNSNPQGTQKFVRLT